MQIGLWTSVNPLDFKKSDFSVSIKREIRRFFLPRNHIGLHPKRALKSGTHQRHQKGNSAEPSSFPSFKLKITK